MSTIGSSLSKGEDGTGLINPSVLNQIAGLAKDLTRTAFNAAVTQERANITNNGAGIWNDGEKISIFGEVGTRIWFMGTSASLSHARNVLYLGKTYALTGDANVFGPTVGTPASGTGVNGDILVDGSSGLMYGPKASGTWPAGVALSTSVSTPLTGISIDGSTIVASVAAPYQMQAADRFVDVNKTTGASTKLILPTDPTLLVDYTITDGKGDAGTHSITVTNTAGTVISTIASNNVSISVRAVSANIWRISA